MTSGGTSHQISIRHSLAAMQDSILHNTPSTRCHTLVPVERVCVCVCVCVSVGLCCWNLERCQCLKAFVELPAVHFIATACRSTQSSSTRNLSQVCQSVCCIFLGVPALSSARVQVSVCWTAHLKQWAICFVLDWTHDLFALGCMHLWTQPDFGSHAVSFQHVDGTWQ